MSTIKRYDHRNQNRKTGKNLSVAKKRAGIHCHVAKGRCSRCRLGSISRDVCIRPSRSQSVVYGILSSQESRELDNAISTLRRAMSED